MKAFLLITKCTSEAVKQQGEVQNDGSFSLVATSSFKKRNSRLQDLHQNAESTSVSDISLTTINIMIYCF